MESLTHDSPTIRGWASNSPEEFEYPYALTLEQVSSCEAQSGCGQVSYDAARMLTNLSPRQAWHLVCRDDTRNTSRESTKDVSGLYLGPLGMVVTDYLDGIRRESSRQPINQTRSLTSFTKLDCQTSCSQVVKPSWLVSTGPESVEKLEKLFTQRNFEKAQRSTLREGRYKGA